MSDTQHDVNSTEGFESYAEEKAFTQGATPVPVYQGVPDVYGAAGWSSPVTSVSINYNQSKKKWTTTFWLCIFFGFLGVHRFYLGHIGWGFLFLFTFGFVGFGVLVDLLFSKQITRRENVRRGYGPVTN